MNTTIGWERAPFGQSLHTSNYGIFSDCMSREDSFSQSDHGVSADSDVYLYLISAGSAESGMVPVVAAGDLLLSTHLIHITAWTRLGPPGDACTIKCG